MVVILQQLVAEVNGFVRAEALALRYRQTGMEATPCMAWHAARPGWRTCDELVPRLARESAGAMLWL